MSASSTVETPLRLLLGPNGNPPFEQWLQTHFTICVVTTEPNPRLLKHQKFNTFRDVGVEPEALRTIAVPQLVEKSNELATAVASSPLFAPKTRRYFAMPQLSSVDLQDRDIFESAEMSVIEGQVATVLCWESRLSPVKATLTSEERPKIKWGGDCSDTG